MKGREILAKLKDVRDDLEAIRDAMQSAEQPSKEECGIAYVSADHAIEIVNELELDLIAEQVGA